MSTKNFEWDDGPDPTTWPWRWNGRAPGYLEIMSKDGPIASVTGRGYARVFAHSKALGQSSEFWNGPEGGCLYETECTSWRDGVRLIEEWLNAIPVWGTKDRIRWAGLSQPRKATT